ncbi:MAG: DUF5686 family protein [Bacteroidales bacterium]|nr:DUF5686 family protein [Bacteroidales bacterium]
MTKLTPFCLKLSLLILFIPLFFIAEARRFSGIVTDIKGDGIPFATIYIHNIKSGISADSRGEFTTMLDPGSYSVEVSSLGYKREKYTIEMDTNPLFRTFVLDEISYELNEAKLSGRSDDRGLSIMKRAIAMAPRFRYQVREYEAENYLKGTVRVNKIPAILKLKAIKEMANFVTGKLFVLESHSTINFTFPDKYKQTVKAFSSSIPDEIDPGDFSMILKSSIYDPVISGMVSPLSPNALSYYKFVYQGIAAESGKVVNKILVIPKRGNSKLFAGHLYIVDNVWNVAYAELVTNQSGVNVNVKINYNEVSEELFLPTTYNIKVDISTLGIKAEGRYFSSSSYKNIKTNSSALVFNGKRLPPPDVNMKKKEALQVAKRLEKELAPLAPENRSLEIKKSAPNTSVIVDSSARKKDSLYWLEVRKVPLRGDEVLSYQKRDSLKIELKEIEKRDSVREQNSGRGGSLIEKIFFGHKYKVSQNLFFSYGGLSKVVGDFNFVDGYQFGQNISLQYTGFKNSPINFDASAYYSSQRRTVLWNSRIRVTHSPLKNGSVIIEGGRESADISNNPGVSRFLNSYSSFLFGINPVKLMDKRYARISSFLDVANGLYAGLSLSLNSYAPLENGNVKSLFGRTGEQNIPFNINNGLVTESSSFILAGSVRYTPEYYYRIDNGRKRYVRSAYPTFTLNFSKAIQIGGFSSSWTNLELGISQTIKTDIYSSLNYKAEGGLFISAKEISLPDYKHFATSNIIASEEIFNDRFLMADGYKFSTNGAWLNLRINYLSEYLLLKRLPFLDTPLLTEALHFKSLWLPKVGIHYSEAGYSFGMDNLARVGVFVSFDKLRYNGIGFRISIPLLKEIH